MPVDWNVDNLLVVSLSNFKKKIHADEVNGQYQVVSGEPSVFVPISEGFVNAD